MTQMLRNADLSGYISKLIHESNNHKCNRRAASPRSMKRSVDCDVNVMEAYEENQELSVTKPEPLRGSSFLIPGAQSLLPNLNHYVVYSRRNPIRMTYDSTLKPQVSQRTTEKAQSSTENKAGMLTYNLSLNPHPSPLAVWQKDGGVTAKHEAVCGLRWKQDESCRNPANRDSITLNKQIMRVKGGVIGSGFVLKPFNI